MFKSGKPSIFSVESKVSVRRFIAVLWTLNALLVYDGAILLGKTVPQEVYYLVVLVWSFYFLKKFKTKGISVDGDAAIAPVAEEPQ